MGYFWEFLWFRLSWDKRALTCKSMVRSVRNKVRRGHHVMKTDLYPAGKTSKVEKTLSKCLSSYPYKASLKRINTIPFIFMIIGLVLGMTVSYNYYSLWNSDPNPSDTICSYVPYSVRFGACVGVTGTLVSISLLGGLLGIIFGRVTEFLFNALRSRVGTRQTKEI